ncbi:GPALPP motifs-containing protein [Sparassis crispa]|uniref:GPALPP motifs-containing protein n=1 Tax=Sparassis crispa TaxID=139825 RepID=A0A401G8T1_9APHY|nr:GPALPP motifs-containing protein [Sparassis crispa]GBE78575.1 GPALPP motifs-containing protein [Sparassis crispa]
MPTLPPDLLAARNSAPASSIERHKPVVGPSFPPSLARSLSRQEEEDDDDEYGPVPLPSGVTVEERDGVKEFLEKEERRRKQTEAASVPKAPQREEWMLVPPSSSDLLGSIDPSKLNRPRRFARSAAPARDVDSSLWTETPAERQQRVADEVAGKRRRAADVDAVDVEGEGEMKKRRKHEEEVRRGVEEHTRNIRGGTLLKQHASALKDEKGEDEPSGIWDHSRDMALSGRLMDDGSRQKFIRDARGLGDRFGTGKSGGYL